ncbi:MAG: molybdenum cofactor guanylyltransferase [Nitrospirae bacterium]|nr:molybdenum cofactor guanylyltransferase [Nitrospirota bacterium]
MKTVTTGMTGVLLAGGKSRRMGRDKRFLELGGRTLLDRAVSALESLFPELIVVVAEPTPQLAGLRHRVVTDLIPDCATLGGLYTGLAYATHPRIFAAACDMPFLNPTTIEWMAGLDRHSDVVMAQLSIGLQPMHAVYAKGCLPHLERMAKAHNLKVQDLCQAPGLSVRLVSEDELRAVDPQFLSFLNVNTLADLEFARKLLAGRPANHGDEA